MCRAFVREAIYICMCGMPIAWWFGRISDGQLWCQSLSNFSITCSGCCALAESFISLPTQIPYQYAMVFHSHRVAHHGEWLLLTTLNMITIDFSCDQMYDPQHESIYFTAQLTVYLAQSLARPHSTCKSQSSKGCRTRNVMK